MENCLCMKDTCKISYGLFFHGIEFLATFGFSQMFDQIEIFLPDMSCCLLYTSMAQLSPSEPQEVKNTSSGRQPRPAATSPRQPAIEHLRVLLRVDGSGRLEDDVPRVQLRRHGYDHKQRRETDLPQFTQNLQRLSLQNCLWRK